MVNYIFIIQKVIKIKNFLTELLSYMEAINSLPGHLSTIVNQSEQGIASLTSSMTPTEQKGVNILTNMSSMSSNNQKDICDTVGVSQTTFNKVLDNTATNEEVVDTLNKLGGIATISQSVQDAEQSGEDDVNSLMPTFNTTISPNIDRLNFPKVTDKFYILADRLDTDLGSLSEKLGSEVNTANNIPTCVSNKYNISQPPQPTNDDILNRDSNSYSSVLNTMPTETFKKQVGFIYDQINLKTRIKVMTNFTDNIKSVVIPFIG